MLLWFCSWLPRSFLAPPAGDRNSAVREGRRNDKWNVETQFVLSLKIFSLWTSLSTKMFLIKANKHCYSNNHLLQMHMLFLCLLKLRSPLKQRGGQGLVLFMAHLSNSSAVFILNTGGALSRNSATSSPFPCCQRNPRTVCVCFCLHWTQPILF